MGFYLYTAIALTLLSIRSTMQLGPVQQSPERSIAVKQEPITTLFPIDTTQWENVRPIRQLIAIIGSFAFGLALVVSLLPKDW